jgi:signal transduction histidine kinase
LTARLKKSVRQTDRLNRLIDSLLEVSRITAGRMALELEPIDLSELLRELCDRFAEQAAQAGCSIRLQVVPPASGQWDRMRLEQVVTNLLSNAIKYGPGKPVDVTVESNATTVRLTVADHGIGIAPESVARIFERFERAVSPRHFGGLGLGLYITRQIAEAHGGSIQVESHVGEGSRFTVELPRISAPMRASSAAVPARA